MKIMIKQELDLNSRLDQSIFRNPTGSDEFGNDRIILVVNRGDAKWKSFKIPRTKGEIKSILKIRDGKVRERYLSESIETDQKERLRKNSFHVGYLSNDGFKNNCIESRQRPTIYNDQLHLFSILKGGM